MVSDTDFWAQKAVSQEIKQSQNVKSEYYRVRIDRNQDGYGDMIYQYEKSTTILNYVSIEHESAIIAGKPRNFGDFLAKTLTTLFMGEQEDAIFNDELTERKLDRGDLDYLLDRSLDVSALASIANSLNLGGTMGTLTESINASHVITTLKNTYRMFTKDTVRTEVYELTDEKVTISDLENGLVENVRIYSDLFDNDEIDAGYEFNCAIKDAETGKVVNVPANTSLSITCPSEQKWDRKIWGIDGVPIKFDALDEINEESESISNYYEKDITIVISKGLRLYEDYAWYSSASVANNGDIAFTVSGVFITPPDKLVYYSSDKDLFKSGKGKTIGSYLYYDSDLNGYYDMVYVLSPAIKDRNGKSVYPVISIGYNYDRKHDFIPYEKVDTIVETQTTFDQLALEPPRCFNDYWQYHFADLKKIDLLFEEDDYDGYEARDNVFEISKLVASSSKKAEFSELFYEVRHETYNKAWEAYSKEIRDEIDQQIRMTLISACISNAITVVSLGTATIAAHIAYFLTYTTLSKFYIDLKVHEMKSRTRANIFYSGNSKKQPTSLSEKFVEDRTWDDSMAAALIGHPGAYYTEIWGGVPGNMYSAKAIVSPPNDARASSWKNAAGLGLYLGDGILNLIDYSSGGNPDNMIGLDFDDKDLDYFLLTSELPSYNGFSNYKVEFATQQELYDNYKCNTLGYLERKIFDETNGWLDTIKVTCDNGKPEYVFVDGESDLNLKTLPASFLYQPLVVDKGIYDALYKNARDVVADASLTYTVQCGYSVVPMLGIDPQDMNVEEKALYASKIPLEFSDFKYPITRVTIEALDKDSNVLKQVEIDPSDCVIDCGNLYFAEKSIDDVVFGSNDEFIQLTGNAGQKQVSYQVKIYFSRIVADTGSEELARMGLSQATAYAIMEYFNQYEYAETTASMIAEIGYTEKLTLISTAISMAEIAAGSYLTKGANELLTQCGRELAKNFLKNQGTKGLVKLIAKEAGRFVLSITVASLKEAYEEIVLDGFIESYFENQVAIAGGDENLAFWLSSLATSARESLSVGSAIGKILGVKSDSSADLRQDMLRIAEMTPEEAQQYGTSLADNLNAKQPQPAQLKRLALSGALKALAYASVSMFFGGIFVATAMNWLGTTVLDVKAMKVSRDKAQLHAEHLRTNKDYDSRGKDSLSDSLKTTKPGELSQEDLANLFKKIAEDSDVKQSELNVKQATEINNDLTIDEEQSVDIVYAEKVMDFNRKKLLLMKTFALISDKNTEMTRFDIKGIDLALETLDTNLKTAKLFKDSKGILDGGSCDFVLRFKLGQAKNAKTDPIIADQYGNLHRIYWQDWKIYITTAYKTDNGYQFGEERTIDESKANNRKYFLTKDSIPIENFLALVTTEVMGLSEDTAGIVMFNDYLLVLGLEYTTKAGRYVKIKKGMDTKEVLNNLEYDDNIPDTGWDKHPDKLRYIKIGSLQDYFDGKILDVDKVTASLTKDSYVILKDMLQALASKQSFNELMSVADARKEYHKMILSGMDVRHVLSLYFMEQAWQKSGNEPIMSDSTKELYNYIKNGLESNPELMKILIPNAFRGQLSQISRLWMGDGNYLSSARRAIKNNPKRQLWIADKTFTASDLKSLEDIFTYLDTLGISGARECVDIIKAYKNHGLSAINFIEKLEAQYAIVSGGNLLTPADMDAAIFGGNRYYFQNYINKYLNPKSRRDYNPATKFSRESLNEIRKFFNRKDVSEKLGYKALECLARIDQYELANPDLKMYVNQQYEIKNEFFFSDIVSKDTQSIQRLMLKIDHLDANSLNTFVEKLYWFGFLCGDGNIDYKTYDITFKLKLKDIDSVSAFASAAGYDGNVKKVPEWSKKYSKWYYTARVSFKCSLMVEDLINLEYFSGESREKYVPSIVKNLINHAKDVAKASNVDWKDTNAGKVALGWLLGFYDAEGSLITGKTKSHGAIAQGFVGLNLRHVGMEVLEEIKKEYGIKNEGGLTCNVKPDVDDPSCSDYVLTFGPKFLEALLRAYPKSMDRKRPQYLKN